MINSDNKHIDVPLLVRVRTFISNNKSSNRRMIQFILAAYSLILSGAFTSNLYSNQSLFVLIWITTSGVLFVYGNISYELENGSVKEKLKNVLRNDRALLILVQFFLLALPFSFLFLETSSLFYLATSAALALLYTYRFNFLNSKLQLKKIPIIKNVIIGIAWAALILVGSGSLYDPNVFMFFVFMSIQITVGSSMRDLQDIKIDKQLGIQTIPSSIGESNSFKLFHILNIGSILSCIISQFSYSEFTIIISIVIYKSINLYFLEKLPQSEFWGQSVNIGTCIVLVFLIVIKNLWTI